MARKIPFYGDRFFTLPASSRRDVSSSSFVVVLSSTPTFKTPFKMGYAYEEWNDFATGFGTSFMMILATEIGDRTFFIAAIMAMRHPRLVVWTGAVGALFVMTVLSAVFGMTAVVFLPPWLVNWVVIWLMMYFGASMLRDGLKMKGVGFEEMEEVKEEMDEKEEQKEHNLSEYEKTSKGKAIRKVLLESFTLTFLAEWGDRSQMATIALAAVYSVFGVILGAAIGHAICTGFAVIGGRLIADYVSEKVVQISGGCLFIAFAFAGMIMELMDVYYE
jgi:Ca2+/H+ antiporter, TMEM165/GDT1 family